jgi:hypothetical protein
MSSAGTNGTNGTDVGTTITTQGDVLYRDGSGLQRLAKGTAGQALVMNSGATAPEWGSAGKVVQIKRASASGWTQSSDDMSNESDFDGNHGSNHVDLNITPTSSSNIIIVWASAAAGIGGNDLGFAGIYHGTGSGSVCINYNSANGYSADGTGMTVVGSFVAGTTSSMEISFRAIGSWGGNNIRLGTSRSTNAGVEPYGDLTVMEVTA